ncbi:MAG: hypothetical protein ACI8XO_004025, partial [Verrucomicrobiales bacterium]
PADCRSYLLTSPKLSGDSGRFSNEDSGDFIKLQPA